MLEPATVKLGRRLLPDARRVEADGFRAERGRERNETQRHFAPLFASAL